MTSFNKVLHRLQVNKLYGQWGPTALPLTKWLRHWNFLAIIFSSRLQPSYGDMSLENRLKIHERSDIIHSTVSSLLYVLASLPIIVATAQRKHLYFARVKYIIQRDQAIYLS